MKIFVLWMAIFMSPLKKPVVQEVFCKMTENGCCVFRRLPTSPWVIGYAISLPSFSFIALLWILIDYGMQPNTIFVMIYNTISSVTFTSLILLKSRSMTMAST